MGTGTFIGIVILAIVVISPFICWRKGRDWFALAGFLALISAVMILLAAPEDDGSGSLEGLGYFILAVVVSGPLALVGFIGAVRLAKPWSPWALSYDKVKLQKAKRRHLGSASSRPRAQLHDPDDDSERPVKRQCPRCNRWVTSPERCLYCGADLSPEDGTP